MYVVFRRGKDNVIIDTARKCSTISLIWAQTNSINAILVIVVGNATILFGKSIILKSLVIMEEQAAIQQNNK